MISGAVASVMIHVVAVAGWLEWRAVRRALAIEPERGTLRLRSDIAVALPSTVHWTIDLAGAQVREASPETAAAALERIGGLQRRWIPTDPAGPKNMGQAADLELSLIHI